MLRSSLSSITDPLYQRILGILSFAPLFLRKMASGNTSYFLLWDGQNYKLMMMLRMHYLGPRLSSQVWSKTHTLGTSFCQTAE